MSKLIDSVDSSINFINDNDRIKLLKDITVKQLSEVIRNLKYSSYPLQRWPINAVYSQYVMHKIMKRMDTSIMFENLRPVLMKIPRSSGLETHDGDNTLSFLTVIHQKKIDTTDSNFMLVELVFPLIFEIALDFVKNNRGRRELVLFNEMFSVFPRYCSVNYYQQGAATGISNHRDPSSFCTVVLLLAGNTDLILDLEDNSELQVNLKIGGAVVSGRINHRVPPVIRTDDRMTINFFF